MSAPGTYGPEHAVNEIRDRGLVEFTIYFVRNYPGPRTIICDPNWHAPKIYRAATSYLIRELAETVDAKNFVDENRSFQKDRAEKAEAALAALQVKYAALVQSYEWAVHRFDRVEGGAA